MKLMREHDGANYAKEQESVEKYLMALIHRYFLADLEYTELQEESLVVEAMSRVKEYLAEHDPCIFAINGRNGIVHLTPRSLGAEPRFNKKTAFNKDFGDTSDTICEGNDPRLSDAREPKYHTHYMNEFYGLEDMLYEREAPLKTQFPHEHNNVYDLNAIDYTGQKEKFDLIIIENCMTSINMYLERLQSIKNEYDSFIQFNSNKLTDSISNLDRITDDVRASKDTEQEWYNRALKYDDDNMHALNEFIDGKRLSLIPKEEMDMMKAAIDLRQIVAGELNYNPIENVKIIKWWENFDVFNPSPEELFIINNELEQD